MSLDNILRVKFGIYLILHTKFCAVVKIYDYLNIFKSFLKFCKCTEVITDKQTDVITSG